MSEQMLKMVAGLIGVKHEDVVKAFELIQSFPNHLATILTHFNNRLDNGDKERAHIIAQLDKILENQAGILAWQAEQTDHVSSNVDVVNLANSSPVSGTGGGNGGGRRPAKRGSEHN